MKKSSKSMPVLLLILVLAGGYLVYQNYGSKILRPRARPASPQMATQLPAAHLPPAMSPAIPPARPSDQPSAPARPMAGPSGSPPGAGSPAIGAAGLPPGASKPAPGLAGPVSAAKPATGAPGSAVPGNPGAGPAEVSSQPAGQPEPVTSLVGTGPAGRPDPFSPLVTQQVPRAPGTATLPPPPGVGLPMPPGFTAPGAPAPGAAPGAGMRVTGIVGGSSRVAILETDEGKSFIVAAGERVEGAQVVSIQEDKVLMKKDNVTFELDLGGERSS